MKTDHTCASCKHFAKGKGGAGYRALLTGIVVSSSRWLPSTADVMTVAAIDKHGQCTFMPEGVAKYRSETCGKWSARSE